MPSCFYQRRQWWCCVVSCLFSTGLQWQNGTTEGAYQTLLYYRVKFFKFSLSLSLCLFLSPPLPSFHFKLSQRWFQRSAGRRLNNVLGFACLKMLPYEFPLPRQSACGSASFQRPCVCWEKESVCKKRAADWAITAENPPDAPRLIWHHTSTLPLTRTTVWWNLQTFGDFTFNMSHHSAFTSDEILHHPKHAWLIKLQETDARFLLESVSDE